jgi:staphylococcal nuclease domain-containing protein 1
LEGVQSSGSGFVGTLLHPAGNISEALLSNGLAQIVDWSIATVTGGPEKYREAEKYEAQCAIFPLQSFEYNSSAKAKRLRVWQSFEPKAPPKNVKELQFDGIVTRIISADTILVESSATGVERKISLSSLRQPRPKEEAFYHQEAKEFLRSRLIGEKVHVSVEYVRPPADGFEERICATVTLGSMYVLIFLCHNYS